RFNEVGPHVECLSVMGSGLVQLPASEENIAEIVMRQGIVGVDSHGLFKSNDRLICPSFLQKRRAEIVVSQGMIGPDCQGRLKMSHRIVHPSSLEENGADAVVRLFIVRLDLHSPLEMSECFIDLS